MAQQKYLGGIACRVGAARYGQQQTAASPMDTTVGYQQNRWQVVQPQQLPTNHRLSEDKVQQWLKSLSQLQTQDFVDDANAQQQVKQQLAKNTLGHVEITLESGKHYTLRFIPVHAAALKHSKKQPYVIAQLQGGQGRFVICAEATTDACYFTRLSRFAYTRPK